MKCLNILKNNLNIGDKEIEKIKEDVEQVENVIEKYNIKFEDTFAISFYNHIVSFINRVIDNEFVEPIDESIVSEITDQSINISQEMLRDIFEKYGREINKSEIYLVSIHIQLAMNKKQ